MTSNLQLDALKHCLKIFQSLADRGRYPQELSADSQYYLGKQGWEFLLDAIKAASQVETTSEQPHDEAVLAPHEILNMQARHDEMMVRVRAGKYSAITTAEHDRRWLLGHIRATSAEKTPGPLCAICDHIEELHNLGIGSPHKFQPKTKPAQQCICVPPVGMECAACGNKGPKPVECPDCTGTSDNPMAGGAMCFNDIHFTRNGSEVRK